MATWKIKELRDNLERTLTTDQHDHACAILKSIEWKIRAEKYHLNVAREAYSEHFSEDEFSPIRLMQLAFEKSEDSAKFQYCTAVREFNLVASATISHTIPEMLAQLISIAFLPGTFQVEEVRLEKVVKALDDGKVKEGLRKIKNSEEYKYLVAFTNMSKHISLVAPDYQLDFESGFQGVRFRKFKYKSKQFAEVRENELIKKVTSLREQYVKLGIDINESMR